MYRTLSRTQVMAMDSSLNLSLTNKLIICAAQQTWRNLHLRRGGFLLQSLRTLLRREIATLFEEALSTVTNATLSMIFHSIIEAISWLGIAKPVWGVGNSLKEISLLLSNQSGKMKWADTTMEVAWVEDVHKSVVKATQSMDPISTIISAFIDWKICMTLVLTVPRLVNWNLGCKEAKKDLNNRCSTMLKGSSWAIIILQRRSQEASWEKAHVETEELASASLRRVCLLLEWKEEHRTRWRWRWLVPLELCPAIWVAQYLQIALMLLPDFVRMTEKTSDLQINWKKGRNIFWQRTCSHPVEMLPDLACGFSFFCGMRYNLVWFVFVSQFWIGFGFTVQRGRICVGIFVLLDKTSDLKIRVAWVRIVWRQRAVWSLRFGGDGVRSFFFGWGGLFASALIAWGRGGSGLPSWALSAGHCSLQVRN